MFEPDTAALIAEVKELDAAATPGPWEADVCDGIFQHWSVQPEVDNVVSVVAMEGKDSWGGCDHRLLYSEADAKFMAESRSLLPQLVGALEEAQAEAAHWKANHDNMVARNDFLRSRLDLPFGLVHERNHRLAVLDRLEKAERYPAAWEELTAWLHEFEDELIHSIAFVTRKADRVASEHGLPTQPGEQG